MTGEQTSRRVALVTGGTRGIGYAVAGHLARDGFDLAVCGRREAGAVEAGLDALRAHGGEAMYCRADITDASARAGMLEQIRKRFGRLDVLVNNAGVAPDVRAGMLDVTEESFERVLRINLQGPYFLTQAAARWMVEQKQVDPDYAGCIINISSVSATMISPNRGEYCVAKAGLSMATQLWAVALGPHGIPVYEIRPGITRTDMTAGVKDKYDALIEEGLLVQPRWGEPADVGKAAAMLARGDLPYSTGQVITVDGGLTLPRL